MRPAVSVLYRSCASISTTMRTRMATITTWGSFVCGVSPFPSSHALPMTSCWQDLPLPSLARIQFLNYRRLSPNYHAPPQKSLRPRRLASGTQFQTRRIKRQAERVEASAEPGYRARCCTSRPGSARYMEGACRMAWTWAAKVHWIWRCQSWEWFDAAGSADFWGS